jgi:hypothetical protein
MEMTPENISQMLAALTEIANVLDKLGVPGLIVLLLAGPAAVLVTILILDHLRGKRMENLNEQYRTSMQAANEQYRAETQNILRDYGVKHAEAVQFYRDNAELVRQYSRLADNLQDVVVNNTRVMERVVALTENNMHCPLAREQAKGQR